MPQAPIDYFGTGAATSPSPPLPFSTPGDEPDLPDPYLFKRYQTPLPLPPGRSMQPKHAPALAPATAAAPTRLLQDENERAARALQRREEESARARREQEERDAELARSLDLELNMMDGGGARARGEPDKPLPPPPRRAEAEGEHRSGMPGAW